jgi:prophage regulatory protein
MTIVDSPTGRKSRDTLRLPTKIVRLDELMEMLSLSATTIRRLTDEGRLPPPIRIGSRAKGWRLAEIEEYLAERPTVGAATPPREAQSAAPKA